LTTEAAICEKPEEKDKNMPAPGAGMGGMY